MEGDPSAPSPRRRGPRLSLRLRTLMLAILAVAAWLGWVTNRARRQRDAVAAIRAYGGFVHYDYEFVNGTLMPGREPWAPRWLRRLVGDEYFREVAAVNLSYDITPDGRRLENHRASPEILVHLKDLPGLRRLHLHAGQARDENLKHVEDLTSLEELFIVAAPVSDAGLAHLKGLRNLKRLVLADLNITDAGLVHLKDLDRLEELGLGRNRISDRGLAHLEELKTLRRLLIPSSMGRITDDGLAHLAGLKNLEEIDLGSDEITDRGLAHLKGLPVLKEVRVLDSKITDGAIEEFHGTRPDVKVVRHVDIIRRMMPQAGRKNVPNPGRR